MLGVGEAPWGQTLGLGEPVLLAPCHGQLCSALGRGDWECFPGPFQMREVDGEGMVGPSGIAESTKNTSSALGAMKEGGPQAGQGAKAMGCPVAWLSVSTAPAKQKIIHIYTHI